MQDILIYFIEYYLVSMHKLKHGTVIPVIC